MNLTKTRAAVLIAVMASTAGVVALARKPAPQGPLSPSALAVAPGAKILFVACATGRQVIELDLASRKIVRKLTVPGEPSGLVLSPDGARLYVTCAAPASVVAVVDVAAGRVLETIPAGHTANSPVLSPDGEMLFIANRFNDDVGVIDLKARKQLRRIRVEREPVSAALTRDGKLLLAASHLPIGRADADVVAAAVNVVDPYAGKVVKTLRLPNGSGQLQQIQVSPDGKYAAVTHVLARHQTPTSQIDRGWMNTNAISIIDIATLSLVNTVLLDGPFNGAANPWAVAWSSDGRQLVVTHAGAHEVSIIEFPALLAKLAAAEAKADVPDDLAFLSGLRRTVRLREIDRGPRAVAVAGGAIYTANYFSDSLSAIDMAVLERHPESIPLGPPRTASLVRQGEFYFHDAGICFQSWQSCASCHPGDARADALNWDLLNDGIGNPKNSRSLLLAHKTPPTMSLGIRDTAEIAVRSGIRYILFTQQPPEVALALDAYLKSLQPVPSPHLVNGQLSEAATRGRTLFNDPVVGCGSCHPSGVFTDLKSYDVGTAGDRERLDTPTLIEIWRTAPYLHDGSAARMRDVLKTKNTQDKHGKTSHLTSKQIEDLVEYILSL
jgi:YVTN family beta-propeller protein